MMEASNDGIEYMIYSNIWKELDGVAIKMLRKFWATRGNFVILSPLGTVFENITYECEDVCRDQ